MQALDVARGRLVGLPAVSVEDATDRALLESWVGGDAEAGDRVVRRFFPLLWRYFRNKVDRDVDDLIQATLAACVDYREHLATANSVRAYLVTIARHQLVAHLRKRPDFDPLVSSIAAPQTSPSSAAARRDARARLRDELQQLPLILQEAVELHIDEDLRGAELAAALGVPDGTARSRLRRAREILTARMGDAAPSITEME